MIDPTTRFTTRVDNYVKYRPRYPAEILHLLESECGLTRETIVADIGSGTGFMTELFLNHGNRVFAVEPNAEMRAAGERLMEKYQSFISLSGTAEETTLPDHAVDLIVAGQAFHWFKADRSRREFARILRPEGWVVLVWNGFDADSSVVTRNFQKIFIDYSTDYCEAVRELKDNDIMRFFSPETVFKRTFANAQSLDFMGLKGRVLSMSYAPCENDEQYRPMIEALDGLFQRYQAKGKIEIRYQTVVYFGQLK